jgi:hypothetical protein
MNVLNIYMKKRSGNIFLFGPYHQLPEFIRYNYFNKILLMLLLVFFSIKITGQSKYKSNVGKSKTMFQSKEENLGHNIFKAFQKKNDSLWVLLYPTNAEYRELTRLMTDAKIVKLPGERIDEKLAEHDKEAISAYKKEFHVFLRQADSLGIHWNEAAYQKLDFESYLPEKFTRKYMNGDIWFACKNSHFVIEGIEAVETPSGYKLQAIKGIRQVDDGE